MTKIVQVICRVCGQPQNVDDSPEFEELPQIPDYGNIHYRNWVTVTEEYEKQYKPYEDYVKAKQIVIEAKCPYNYPDKNYGDGEMELESETTMAVDVKCSKCNRHIPQIELDTVMCKECADKEDKRIEVLEKIVRATFTLVDDTHSEWIWNTWGDCRFCAESNYKHYPDCPWGKIEDGKKELESGD